MTIKLAAFLAVGTLTLTVAATLAAQAAAAPSDPELIASAEAAGPPALAKHAAIAAADADGKMRMLRHGTNGFTCMPDRPNSPGPDPMCLDANAMAWVEALITHQPPPEGRPGMMYMLAGGSDASNTDPVRQRAQGRQSLDRDWTPCDDGGCEGRASGLSARRRSGYQRALRQCGRTRPTSI